MLESSGATAAPAGLGGAVCPLPAGPNPLCPGIALCSCCSCCPELWCPEQSRGPTGVQCQPELPWGCGTVDAANPRHRRLWAWHRSSTAMLGALGAVWTPLWPTVGPGSPIPRCALGLLSLAPGTGAATGSGTLSSGWFSVYAMCLMGPGPTAAPVPGPVVRDGSRDPSVLFLGSTRPRSGPPIPPWPQSCPPNSPEPGSGRRAAPLSPAAILIQRN